MTIHTPSVNTLVFGHTRMIKRDDGIIEVTCKDDFCYEVTHLKEMDEPTGKLCEYKRHPVLFLVGQHTTISAEAREFGATPEATKYSVAEAYVIKSMSQRIIGNFFIRMNNPSVPTRLFTSKTEAEKWLRLYIS